MPSRTPIRKYPVARWLRSQGLGLVCGQATVVLLAIGSFVLVATQDTGSAEIQADTIRPFFENPSPTHTWFYLLCVVMVVYAVNTTLATWHSVSTRWGAGVRTVQAYAAPVIHLAFLIALLAHLIGGWASEERGMVTIHRGWTEVEEGVQARLVDLEVDTFPNRQLRSVDATVEVDRGDETTIHTVGFNHPLQLHWPGDSLYFTRFGQTGIGALITAGARRYDLAVGDTCMLLDRQWRLDRIFSNGHWGERPVVRLLSVVEGGEDTAELLLMLGQPHRLPDGSVLAQLDSIEEAMTIQLRRRYSAGNFWAMISALVLGLGLMMMGRRWVGWKSTVGSSQL